VPHRRLLRLESMLQGSPSFFGATKVVTDSRLWAPTFEEVEIRGDDLSNELREQPHA
jgi:hypothetical protein